MKFVFRPSEKGVPQVLGELESQVMKEVWRNPDCTAREVLDHLRRERSIAHTTVLTILSRLCRKGLLTRRREGKAFLYSSVVDQQQFNEMVTRGVLEGLLKENSRPILSTFVDLVSTDEELLEELDELVRRKRG
jgi:predicted transcriptional regulator